jgi:hypothetical protein
VTVLIDASNHGHVKYCLFWSGMFL